MTISVDVQLRQLPTARYRHRLRKPSARRALTELGPNDTKRNLIFVERVLALSQEKFRERWNFDPVAERPIATGGQHFLWTPVSQDGQDPRPHAETSPTVSDRLSASDTAQNRSLHAAPATHPTTASADEHSRIPSSTENHSQLRSPTTASPEQHSSTTASPTDHHHSAETSCNASSTNTAPVSIDRKKMTETRLTQRKITEFGKQRKRMLSQCKFEDDDPEALGPSPSKRRASEALRVR